jgi:cbb3-type cytochrome oxidase maturation protein
VDVLYVMVFISLALSFGFLAFFFWAVDNDQLSSLDAASFDILEDQNQIKKEKSS